MVKGESNNGRSIGTVEERSGSGIANVHNNLYLILDDFTKCKLLVHSLLTFCKTKNIISVQQIYAHGK